MDSPYYAKVYEMIHRDFGKLPLKIFGRQNLAPDDPRVLSYMSDEELIRLYQHSRVMVYPSEEPRHLHYTPLEAIMIGTPVLYRQGGLMERLAGRELPGQCKDNREMCEKASRLLDGDDILSEAIRSTQTGILRKLSDSAVLEKWTEAMQNLKLSRPRFASNRVPQVLEDATNLQTV
jgi:glycosyltransferase involved in cell wall biosynthesis